MNRRRYHSSQELRIYGPFLVHMVVLALFCVSPHISEAQTVNLLTHTDHAGDAPHRHTPVNNVHTDQKNIQEIMKHLIDRGEYKKALDLIQPYTSEPLAYPELVSDYISILVWDGNYAYAVTRYESLPDSFPRRAYLRRNIGKAYYELKNFRQASLHYKDAVELTPEDREAQKGLVASLIQLGDFENASRYLDRFIKEDPQSLPLALSQAKLSFLKGEYVAAFRQFDAVAERDAIAGEQAYRLRDELIDALSEDQKKAMIERLRVASRQDGQAMQGYLLMLIVNKEYREALQIYETAGAAADNYPSDLLCRIAWAYFKTDDIDKAEQLYRRVLARKPGYGTAGRGLAYVLASKGQGTAALAILDALTETDDNYREMHFARAFAYEKMRLFWKAVAEYDRILARSPGNRVATKLRLRALSDLGVSAFALEQAAAVLPRDEDLHNSLKDDVANKHMGWQEPDKAVGILAPLSTIKDATRYRYDYLAALHENDDMEDVVREYEALLRDGIVPPPWVMEMAASAYLYLEQPHKALEIYEQALEKNPRSVNGRKGKFYTLQELRRWQNAGEVLDDLDREQPELTITGNAARPNWFKLELAIDRGWFILYEERFREAETYFWNLRVKAPASMSIRSGLAHTYLWRGWPRKALREFRIIETTDPLYTSSLIGMSAALDALAYKEESRELAQRLLAAYPKDKHVRGLVRMLQVEDMRELAADFAFTADDEGFSEIRTEASYAHPVSLYTRLFGTLLWQKSSDDNNTAYYRRAGIGIRHIWNSSLSIEQKFSVNFDDGNDFGSLTRLIITPDDYWRIDLSYDSFTTDVPLRARVFDITSDRFNGTVTYRESEWRSYGLSLTQMNFSDDNRRQQALMRYEQGLLVRNDWKMRLFLDLYFSRNSRDGAPYFNPDHDMSISVTHLTEQILRRIYRTAFIHRLFLTLGMYNQSSYSPALIGSVRYQQEHAFSDTLSLLWGVGIGRQVYDGEAVTSYGVDLSLRGRF